MHITGSLNQQQQDQIAGLLQQRSATQPCPRCRYSQFAILGSTGRIQLTGPVQVTGQPNVLTTGLDVVLAVCTNCGFVSQHAISILDREG